MITQDLIAKFYSDVDRLGLKFPVAEISRATKESKGNVSRILKRQLAPSESFINRFYDSFKNVSHETSQAVNEQILANLKELRALSVAILTSQEAGQRIVLGSLERLEGRNEGELADTADRLTAMYQERILKLSEGK